MYFASFTLVLICSSMARSHHKPSRTEIQDERNDNFYNYHYSINDADSHQFKKETKKDGKVTGSYGITDPDGRKRIVYYIADKNGFRAKIDSNEPGVMSMNPADIEIMKFNQFNHFMNRADEVDSLMRDNDFMQSKTPVDSPEYVYPIQPERKKKYKKANNIGFPVSYALKIDHDDFGAKFHPGGEEHSDEFSKSWNQMSNNFPSANFEDNYIFHER